MWITLGKLIYRLTKQISVLLYRQKYQKLLPVLLMRCKASVLTKRADIVLISSPHFPLF